MLEAEQVEDPTSFMPEHKAKHRPPRDKVTFDVQEDNNKKRKVPVPKRVPLEKSQPAKKEKTASTTVTKPSGKRGSKKKTKEDVEDNAMVTNLAMVADILNDTPSNENASSTNTQTTRPITEATSSAKSRSSEFSKICIQEPTNVH